MPTPRYVPAGAVVNNILYVIGGKQNGGQLQVVESYDPTSNTWDTHHMPMPTARDSIKAVVKNGIIYVIGGFNNGSGRLTTVESYDPSTDTWTEDEPLLIGKSSMAAGLLGSTIVAASGLSDSGASGNNEGNKAPTSSPWTSLASDHAPRWDVCSASILGQLYSASGRNNTKSLKTVESFSLSENKWIAVAPIPLATNTAGEAAVNNLLFCFGGSSNGNEGQGTLYNNVQIYHP
jgi:hypothetical protein